MQNLPHVLATTSRGIGRMVAVVFVAGLLIAAIFMSTIWAVSKTSAAGALTPQQCCPCAPAE